MKLILAVVHRDDSGKLIDALTAADYRATVISTTGGFLKEGNATIFMGVNEEVVDSVLSIIRENCESRTQYVNPLPPVMEPGELYMPYPVEVQVGGATVFVLKVDRYVRF